MNRRLTAAIGVVLGIVMFGTACDETTPSPTVAIQLSASPSPTNGGPCAGCGAGSTEREVTTTVAIQETGGAAATVVVVTMSLTENGTNVVIASGEFATAAVQQLAGSSRVPADGRLNVPVGLHYPAGQGGRAATLTLVVRVRDDRGIEASATLAVPVPAT